MRPREAGLDGAGAKIEGVDPHVAAKNEKRRRREAATERADPQRCLDRFDVLRRVAKNEFFDGEIDLIVNREVASHDLRDRPRGGVRIAAVQKARRAARRGAGPREVVDHHQVLRRVLHSDRVDGGGGQRGVVLEDEAIIGLGGGLPVADGGVPEGRFFQQELR